jgi:hypothetical protein
MKGTMMATIIEMADKLRQAAEELEKAGESLRAPAEPGLSIQAAAERLRALLGPDQYFTIEAEFDYHSHRKPVVSWQVYDGKKHRRAGTLAGCIEAVMLAAKPEETETATEAAATVEAALSADSPDAPAAVAAGVSRIGSATHDAIEQWKREDAAAQIQ